MKPLNYNYVLVIGATGYVGTAIVDKLLTQGFQVLALSTTATKLLEVPFYNLYKTNLYTFDIDLLNEYNTLKLLNILLNKFKFRHAVLSFGYVKGCNYKKYITVNVSPIAYLAKFLNENKINTVYLSSIASYTNSLYGITKNIAQSILLNTFQNSKLVILKLGAVIGNIIDKNSFNYHFYSQNNIFYFLLKLINKFKILIKIKNINNLQLICIENVANKVFEFIRNINSYKIKVLDYYHTLDFNEFAAMLRTKIKFLPITLPIQLLKLFKFYKLKDYLNDFRYEDLFFDYANNKIQEFLPSFCNYLKWYYNTYK